MQWLVAHWAEVALIVSEILGLAGLGGFANVLKEIAVKAKPQG